MTGIFEKVTQQSQTKSTTVVDKNPLNLAASWYVAMPSKDLGKKLKQIELFGRQLVAWRDQNGQPVLMEAYCSHMGASLALGKITDDCIQCPFHHWRYDNSGNCVSIPDIENVPPTARQVTYNTAEKYGYIWVWYGSVMPLYPLPEFSAAEDEQHSYMPWRIRVNAKTTVRRVLENIYDHYHIIALHHMPVNAVQLTKLDQENLSPNFEPLFEKGAWFGAVMEAPIKRFVGPTGAIAKFIGLKAKTFTMQIESWSGGHIAAININNQLMYRGLVATTPIAENQTTWHILIMVKKTGFFWKDIFARLGFGWQNQVGAIEDIPVFDTMKHDGGGAYISYDRVMLKFREFYQSWVDKAEV